MNKFDTQRLFVFNFWAEFQQILINYECFWWFFFYLRATFTEDSINELVNIRENVQMMKNTGAHNHQYNCSNLLYQAVSVIFHCYFCSQQKWIFNDSVWIKTKPIITNNSQNSKCDFSRVNPIFYKIMLAAMIYALVSAVIYPRFSLNSIFWCTLLFSKLSIRYSWVYRGHARRWLIWRQQPIIACGQRAKYWAWIMTDGNHGLPAKIYRWTALKTPTKG